MGTLGLRGAQIGSTLAELRNEYGAAFVGPDQGADIVVWAKGSNGTAIGFDLDADGRVRGFRVGDQAFVWKKEFCA